MSYEYFYPGTPYSLEPTYGNVFTGYRVPAGQLGATTSIQTANQVREVSNLLNQGIKNVEVSTINPEVFDMIPKQHLKEINRITKLTGTSASVHAPLVEASGYTQQGWDEAARKIAENQMSSFIERAHEIDPKGNIPVTFHSSTGIIPEGEERIKTKDGEQAKAMLYVDPRTGSLGQIKQQDKYFPREDIPQEYIKKYHLSSSDITAIKAGKKLIPQIELDKRNEESWIKALNDVNFYASRGEEYIDRAFMMQERMAEKQGLPEEEVKKMQKNFFEVYSKIKPENVPEELRAGYADVVKTVDAGRIFLRDSYNQLRELYDRVYNDARDEDKKTLDNYKRQIEKSINEGIEKKPERLKEFAEIIERGVKTLGSIEKPKIFIPLNDFLLDKSSETFANVAMNAYNKFGSNSPIVSIENPPAGDALSRAEDLKKLVETAREKFVKQAVEKKNMSQDEAKAVAEKIIGVTWDTSHISMLRKFGYDKNDMVKEAEKIAPFVKHVHYNDNFGSSHTDLPPGMGDLPMKAIMEKLDKAGFKGKKVFEGGGFFQNFQTSPHPYVLEGSGSPLYTMKAPYWNQFPVYGNYFQTPSAYFPEQHFSLYGGGLTTLPVELGGQMLGKQSRVSGTNID